MDDSEHEIRDEYRQDEVIESPLQFFVDSSDE